MKIILLNNNLSNSRRYQEALSAVCGDEVETVDGYEDAISTLKNSLDDVKILITGFELDDTWGDQVIEEARAIKPGIFSVLMSEDDLREEPELALLLHRPHVGFYHEKLPVEVLVEMVSAYLDK